MSRYLSAHPSACPAKALAPSVLLVEPTYRFFSGETMRGAEKIRGLWTERPEDCGVAARLDDERRMAEILELVRACPPPTRMWALAQSVGCGSWV